MFGAENPPLLPGAAPCQPAMSCLKSHDIDCHTHAQSRYRHQHVGRRNRADPQIAMRRGPARSWWWRNHVARVVQRLGGVASAIYPAGGATGELLRRLVGREGIKNLAISVAEETRENFTVLEQTSSKQYRFVLPGSPLSEAEWHACLDALEAMDTVPPFIVCSGSLPPGVPDDFYARVARFAKLTDRS